MSRLESKRLGFVETVRVALRRRRERIAVKRWRQAGRPGPAPHLIKRQVVLDHARRYGCRQMVETGTFMGDMVEAVRGELDNVISIELSEELYDKARRRFADCDNVEIIQGDSGVELGKVLKRIDQPTLFWLDGHWSAGPTAKGEKETPISEELTSLLPLLGDGHVVLIDDARLFGKDTDYPPLEAVRQTVQEQSPGTSFEVDSDIIRIVAPRERRVAA